jgi:DNA-binding transcriptional ArsR family regulator
MDCCSEQIIHKEALNKAVGDMPNLALVEKCVTLFKALGDNTRMKIICLLISNELCVCDIAYALEMEQSAISHQLKILRENKILKSRKEGKTVYYSFNDEHIADIVNKALVHMSHG